MTISTFQKDPIIPRKGTEAHVAEPKYEGSEKYHTKHSYGEKNQR